jgi:hypothetical protein
MSNMPDTVLDLAKKDEDALKRRMFDSNKFISNCIIVQSYVADRERDFRYVRDKKLNKQTDPSRTYLNMKERTFF